MFDGLAFLPVQKLKDMYYLDALMPSNAEPLSDYFDATNVSVTLRSIQRPSQITGQAPLMRFRRTLPFYPLQVRNV